MKISSHIQKPIAALLSLWLSGVVLLLGCQASMASSRAESCPLAGTARMSHHCDRSMPDDPSREAIGRRLPFPTDCCAFLPALFDKTRTVQSIAKIAFAEAIDRPTLTMPLIA